MNVFMLISQTPAIEDLRTLLAICTMQLERCAVFNRVTRASTITTEKLSKKPTKQIKNNKQQTNAVE